MQGFQYDRKSITIPELLCPAGDSECLQAALTYGADAVYLGGRAFGMRSGAQNFTEEQLAKAVLCAHKQNIKVYLTLNTLPHNDQIEQLRNFISHAATVGIDAFIVSDIGVLQAVKRYAPNVDIHISVQAGIVNYLAARAFYELGAKRIVVARELTLEQIKTIRDKTPPRLEIEAFIHGAMCVSHSGRCLLSDYFTGRDANRGDCAQPCRWNYSLVEKTRPGQYMDITEDTDGTYILNANDLCMAKYIKELVSAGISSFKIEGRAKAAYYVAVTTNAYRQALNLYSQNPVDFETPQWIIDELHKISHRPYCTGFYFGRPQGKQNLTESSYIRTHEIACVVEGYENGLLHVTMRNRFFAGDTFDVLTPNEMPFLLKAELLLDQSGAPLEVANHAMQDVYIPFHRPLVRGTLLRKSTENKNSL